MRCFTKRQPGCNSPFRLGWIPWTCVLACLRACFTAFPACLCACLITCSRFPLFPCLLPRLLAFLLDCVLPFFSPCLFDTLVACVFPRSCPCLFETLLLLTCSRAFVVPKVQGEHHGGIGGGYARQHHTHGARSHEQWQLPTGFLLCGGSSPGRNVHHGHQHLQTRQGAEGRNN